MFRHLLFILFAIIPLIGFAEDCVKVSGTVLEAAGTHNPIPNATIKVLNASDSSFVTIVSASEFLVTRQTKHTIEEKNRVYTGGYQMELGKGRSYILCVRAFGYYPIYRNLDLSDADSIVNTCRMSPFYLSLVSQTLDEVVVRASRIKFYSRGDTLVYDADAFRFADGNMLDVLIRQLPGAELKEDGVIYVNGKIVETLLLDGKSFFDGNRQLILNNLSAYLVKNVEVYDQSGSHGGMHKCVMDVKLRKNYKSGMVLNLDGGYGTSDCYLGRLFAMKHLPKGLVSIYFNANNVNDRREPGERTTWTPEKMPVGVTETLMGGVYYHVTTNNGCWNISGKADLENIHESDETHSSRVNYLVTETTSSYMFQQNTNKSLKFSTKHTLAYSRPDGYYSISLSPSTTFCRWDNMASVAAADFNREFNQMTSDFIQNIYKGDHNDILKNILFRSISMVKSTGHLQSSNVSLSQNFRFPNSTDILKVLLFGSYENRHEEKFDRYEINFGQVILPNARNTRYFKNFPNENANLGAEVDYSHQLGKGMSFAVSYRFDHQYRKETSSLYGLESFDDLMFGKLPSAVDYETKIDQDKSYLSRLESNSHKMTLEYYYSDSHLDIRYIIPMSIVDRRLDYLRGRMDTVINHRTVLFDIGNAEIQWKNGNHRFFWGWGLKSKAPDLINMVNITDDTNPLFITKGNGNLKNALQFNSRIQYANVNRSTGRRLVIEGGFTTLANGLSQCYAYDTQTGICESEYHNVNGNWSAQGSVTYGMRLGKGVVWGNKLGMEHTTHVDLVGQDQYKHFRNKLYDHDFYDRLFVEYNIRRNRIGINCEAHRNIYTSNMSDFETQKTWNIESSINAVFELSSRLQLATDLTMYNRRGYNSSRLNTNNYIWNTRLTYRAMKGHLLLMLDGYDIFHDLSNVSFTMNAQGRAESFRTVLPRYFLFHVQWMINR